MSRPEDARNLTRTIYNTLADLIPNLKNKTVTVALHNMANKCEHSIIEFLCEELNATNTIFPGTAAGAPRASCAARGSGSLLMQKPAP